MSSSDGARPQSPLARIESNSRLDPIASTVQRAIGSALAALGPLGRPIGRFLAGTFQSHPLHVDLTDIPSGAWTAAVVMDAVAMATDSHSVDAGADAAVAIGIVGASAAAVAGPNDWHVFKQEERPRRVGLVHAGLNVAGLALFGASFVARKRGNRAAGRLLGLSGYAVAGLAAYLGGTLVYRERVGVDHAPLPEDLPEKWTAVLPEAELPEGKIVRREAGGSPIVLVKRSGRIHALADQCAHYGGPLSEGTLEDGGIRCPWHGTLFCLKDGAVIEGPSAFRQPVLETRVRKNQIEVRRTGIA